MLTIWTIYKNPTDYPLLYVARAFNACSGQPLDMDVILSPTLEPLRDLMIVKDLFLLKRNANDDPVIVESWV